MPCRSSPPSSSSSPSQSRPGFVLYVPTGSFASIDTIINVLTAEFSRAARQSAVRSPGLPPASRSDAARGPSSHDGGIFSSLSSSSTSTSTSTSTSLLSTADEASAVRDLLSPAAANRRTHGEGLPRAAARRGSGTLRGGACELRPPGVPLLHHPVRITFYKVRSICPYNDEHDDDDDLRAASQSGATHGGSTVVSNKGQTETLHAYMNHHRSSPTTWNPLPLLALSSRCPLLPRATSSRRRLHPPCKRRPLQQQRLLHTGRPS